MPVAVSTITAPTAVPQMIKFVGIRVLGPPKTAASATIARAAVAITDRGAVESTFATNHPAAHAAGITSTRRPRTKPSVRSGRPSMSMVCMPDTVTTMIEFTAKTASAAIAGADRLHTLCSSAPGRSTAGSPRARNQRSAASDSARMNGNPSAPTRIGTPLARATLSLMQRIIGTEVEYGISSPSDPAANPILTSTQAVLAYAAAAGIQRAKRTRWDYEVESPLRDARGFDLSRVSGPVPIVDADEVGAANMILTNGARLYVDHAHPEYSAPEVTDPMDAVIWDKAGERVMEAAARHVASVPGAAKLQLYKNNVDGKGASYGTHENYLMSRQTPFSAVIAGLTTFMVSRQVVTGSGRVGIGPAGDEPGFQLSQRADYIEVEVGLETTLKRGIINTRDEPHADADKYRRLHVIIGDANLAETSTYLKVGTTSLVLDLIEEGIDLSDLALARPVHAVHVVSRDPSLRATVALADGRELTALALQRIYLDRVATLLDSRDPDPRATHVVETWAHVLDLLERDPMECAELLDWPAKLRLLEGFRQRENLAWSAPRLQLVDLQYSDVRLDKGLYNRLVARGSMKRLVTEQQVLDAVDNPPTDTRAYFRGECLRRFGADIAAASWDSVIFDLGGDSLVRIPTLEPLRGSKAHVGALLDSVNSAAELVEQLTN